MATREMYLFIFIKNNPSFTTSISQEVEQKSEMAKLGEKHSCLLKKVINNNSDAGGNDDIDQNCGPCTSRSRSHLITPNTFIQD